MKKPENTFINSVHKLLPPELHAEKMNNPYRSGTADCWYSGDKGDIWVEYKFIPKLPVKNPNILADCSPLQIKWLRERHLEGRKVYVILGCPTGGVVLSDLEWERNISLVHFNQRIVNRQTIAEWLTQQTRGMNRDPKRTGNLRRARTVAACDERAINLHRPV